MNWHKRIELWILLALVIAGVFFVLSRHPTDEEVFSAGTVSIATGKDDAPLIIHRCTITRDYGNARLDMDVRVRNDSSEKLVLQTPRAKLLTSAGREIPSFFLPFDAQPEVPPQSAQDVQLRYWLDAADLKDTLVLEVDGKSVPVKSAKPLDLNTLKNAEKVTVTSLDW